jgi:site-specific recombinase XerD
MTIKKATKVREEKKVRGVFEKDPGTGIWWIQYFADGARKREKVGRKSDAISLYQQRKSQIRAGAKLPPNLRQRGETLAVVIDRALEWYASHKPKSVRNVTIHLEEFKADLGHRVAADLKPSDIDRWIGAHEAWSPATMNRYKATLGKALQLAVADGHLQSNVARLVTARLEDNTRVRWLKDKEEDRLRAVMGPELTDIVEFALHVGTRKSEQFSLTWDKVDFNRRIVQITKTKTGKDREVPMSETCYRLLTRLHADKSKTNNHVFQSTQQDAPLQDPKKTFATATEKAKLKNFHFHDLRHTFASRLVMAGVDLYTVSKLLGHSSVVVTQRYAHLSPNQLAGAVSVLDKPRG